MRAILAGSGTRKPKFACTHSANLRIVRVTDLLGEPGNPCPESSGIIMMEPRSPSAVGALLVYPSRSTSTPTWMEFSPGTPANWCILPIDPAEMGRVSWGCHESFPRPHPRPAVLRHPRQETGEERPDPSHGLPAHRDHVSLLGPQTGRP